MILHDLDLKMVKLMAFEYLIIQFVKLHDVDRLMPMAVIHWNEENHVAIALMRHQIQQNVLAHVHR